MKTDEPKRALLLRVIKVSDISSSGVYPNNILYSHTGGDYKYVASTHVRKTTACVRASKHRTCHSFPCIVHCACYWLYWHIAQITRTKACSASIKLCC